MSTSGWIKLHRQISDNPLWFAEPFTRAQAWIDLLLLANHKDGFFYCRGVKVIVKRGEVGLSIVNLSKRWKWSRGKTQRHLNELENEHMIVQQKNNVTSVISIAKYDDYQIDSTTDSTTDGQQTDSRRTADGQQTDINKNENNAKNENNEKNSLSQARARESFENESLIDESKRPPKAPTLEDVIEVCRMKVIPEFEGEIFFYKYEAVGWCYSTKHGLTPIQNWQSKLISEHKQGWLQQTKNEGTENAPYQQRKSAAAQYREHNEIANSYFPD